MSRYDIYGIGNALVDIDIEIDEALLSSLEIDKGLMTLIDQSRHQALLKELHDKPRLMACGGSAANTVIAAQQLGGQCFYSCKVANDASGDFFWRDLVERGIHTNLTADNREAGHTGKCFVFVTPDADRTMNTHLGITETLSVNEVNEQAIRNANFVYIEGYLAPSATAKAAAMKTKAIADAAGVKTSLTLSDPNMTRYFRDDLIDMIGSGVDLLFCNEDEALSFTESSTLGEAAKALQKYAKSLAITRGANGSVIYDGQGYIEIPAYKTQLKDTVGAGDIYAGALLQGLSDQQDITMAGHQASMAAAKIVAKVGPRLSDEEAKTLRSEIIKQHKAAMAT